MQLIDWHIYIFLPQEKDWRGILLGRMCLGLDVDCFVGFLTDIWLLTT